MQGLGTAASRGSYAVRDYGPQDAGQVLDLLEAVFGGWPRDVDVGSAEEFFRWKHSQSPFGPSVLMVAEQDGAIIGFQAWQRWRLRAEGRTFEARRGVDLAVRPDHRRRGIHTAFMRKIEDEFPGQGVAMTFSHPNARSRPGGIKAGRTPAGKMPIFVRPRASALSRREPDLAAIQEATALATEAAAAALEDDRAISDLLERSWEPRDRFSTAKDIDYLRWKYGSMQDYRALAERDGGAVTGIAIFRVHSRGSRSEATICEVLVAPDDPRSARRLLRAVARAAPVDLLTAHFPSGSPARRAALLCGFVPLPGRTPTTVMPLEEISPDPTRPGAWALGSGDLDLI
jgi:GNAT superfamily N-acetyltransferase